MGCFLGPTYHAVRPRQVPIPPCNRQLGATEVHRGVSAEFQKETRPGKRQQNMTELWKFTVFCLETMENHGQSPFLGGKLWQITIFTRKTMENHQFEWDNDGNSFFL